MLSITLQGSINHCLPPVRPLTTTDTVKLFSTSAAVFHCLPTIVGGRSCRAAAAFQSIVVVTPLDAARGGDVLPQHGHELVLGEGLGDHLVGALRGEGLDVLRESVAGHSCAHEFRRDDGDDSPLILVRAG